MKNNPAILKYEDVEKICEQLKNNKCMICQTDTIFGVVGINMEKIYEIKKRPLTKKVGVFVSDAFLIPNISNKLVSFLNKYWPNPVSIIINDVSYRIPSYPPLLKIVNVFKKLYQSSANISGEEVVNSIEEAIDVFSSDKDVFFVEASKKNTVNSTIVDLKNKKVIRQGDFDATEMLEEFTKLNLFI